MQRQGVCSKYSVLKYSMHIYVYIYTHIHINAHMHIYIYRYIHTHIYIYINTCTHIPTCTQTRTHTYIYIHTLIYIYTYTHIHTYIHTYILIPIHISCKHSELDYLRKLTTLASTHWGPNKMTNSIMQMTFLNAFHGDRLRSWLHCHWNVIIGSDNGLIPRRHQAVAKF